MQNIPVNGIWLRVSPDHLGRRIEVLAEVEGTWRKVITEQGGGPISHIVEPAGIAAGRPDE